MIDNNHPFGEHPILPDASQELHNAILPAAEHRISQETAAPSGSTEPATADDLVANLTMSIEDLLNEIQAVTEEIKREPLADPLSHILPKAPPAPAEPQPGGIEPALQDIVDMHRSQSTDDFLASILADLPDLRVLPDVDLPPVNPFAPDAAPLEGAADEAETEAEHVGSGAAQPTTDIPVLRPFGPTPAETAEPLVPEAGATEPIEAAEEVDAPFIDDSLPSYMRPDSEDDFVDDSLPSTMLPDAGTVFAADLVPPVQAVPDTAETVQSFEPLPVHTAFEFPVVETFIPEQSAPAPSVADDVSAAPSFDGMPMVAVVIPDVVSAFDSTVTLADNAPTDEPAPVTEEIEPVPADEPAHDNAWAEPVPADELAPADEFAHAAAEIEPVLSDGFDPVTEEVFFSDTAETAPVVEDAVPVEEVAPVEDFPVFAFPVDEPSTPEIDETVFPGDLSVPAEEPVVFTTEGSGDVSDTLFRAEDIPFHPTFHTQEFALDGATQLPSFSFDIPSQPLEDTAVPPAFDLSEPVDAQQAADIVPEPVIPDFIASATEPDSATEEATPAEEAPTTEEVLPIEEAPASDEAPVPEEALPAEEPPVFGELPVLQDTLATEDAPPFEKAFAAELEPVDDLFGKDLFFSGPTEGAPVSSLTDETDPILFDDQPLAVEPFDVQTLLFGDTQVVTTPLWPLQEEATEQDTTPEAAAEPQPESVPDFLLQPEPFFAVAPDATIEPLPELSADLPPQEESSSSAQPESPAQPDVQPESVVETQPESLAETETEFFVETQPESAVQPEPVVETQPEPPAETEPLPEQPAPEAGPTPTDPGDPFDLSSFPSDFEPIDIQTGMETLGFDDTHNFEFGEVTSHVGDDTDLFKVADNLRNALLVKDFTRVFTDNNLMPESSNTALLVNGVSSTYYISEGGAAPYPMCEDLHFTLRGGSCCALVSDIKLTAYAVAREIAERGENRSDQSVIAGEDAAHQREILYIGSDSALPMELTCLEFMLYTQSAVSEPGEDTENRRQRIGIMLAQLGLSDVESLPLRDIPYNKRILILAAAAAINPSIGCVIISDPAFDVGPQEDMLARRVFALLNNRGKCTLLACCSEHLMAAVANRIAVIQRGKLVFFGGYQLFINSHCLGLLSFTADDPEAHVAWIEHEHPGVQAIIRDGVVYLSRRPSEGDVDFEQLLSDLTAHGVVHNSIVLEEKTFSIALKEVFAR